jgi:hypothetical protein
VEKGTVKTKSYRPKSYSLAKNRTLSAKFATDRTKNGLCLYVGICSAGHVLKAFRSHEGVHFAELISWDIVSAIHSLGEWNGRALWRGGRSSIMCGLSTVDC